MMQHNQPKKRVSVILDNVRSAMNVGAVFRSADAFAVHKIYLCGITAKPPHKEINKTALGAQETVTWQHEEDIFSCIDSLRKEQYQIIAIEQAPNSHSLLHFKPQLSEKYAFIFGHEVFGINKQVLRQVHKILDIPQYGKKDSLNISVSVGITLWHSLYKTHQISKESS